MFETIHAKPVAGYQSVQLPRQHNRAKREAKLAIRFASVTLCPPKTRSGLANVEVQMVLAQEVDAPEGAEPIESALLTTAAAGSFEQACEKVARYTQALMTQIAQTAVCYRHHSVDQRLSRWRLSTADRLPEGELVMTEELVADLLGVRRESVTKAARRLRDAGYIRYRRGHISILDRIGLKTCACECFGVVKKELGRLLLPLLPLAGGEAAVVSQHVA